MQLSCPYTFTIAGRDLSMNGQRLNMVIDGENKGVPKHLGRIADGMSEWEGRIAEELGLTLHDVKQIKTLHPYNFKLQVYV